MYFLYERPFNTASKYLYYYLIIVAVAITFRYGWFMWGLGLLPMAASLKSFIKWVFIIICLTVFGIFVSRYICAPYPYNDIVADRIIRNEQFSVLESIRIIWGKFSQNLKLFMVPGDRFVTTCMRYLLLALLLLNSWYALTKRNKFTIACTLISWTYFIACLAFYAVYWEYDERALAVLNPLLAFSLISSCNSFIFYPIIAVQLYFFPGVVEEISIRNKTSISINASSQERISREITYSKIRDLVTDEKNIVIALDVDFIIHGNPNYFANFPLVNNKGYPIHYSIYLEGKDLRRIHHPDYLLKTYPVVPAANNQLIYADRWMYLYRIQ